MGEYSLIEADSSDVTLDALEDWYFNYVEESEYDNYLILHTDRDDNSGVHAISVAVSVNVILSEGSTGALFISDSSSATLYYPFDGSLAEYVTDQEDDATGAAEETEETI